MALVIYLHGFASKGESPKSMALAENLVNHTVVAPDLPIDPVEVERIVNNIVESHHERPVVFVGTSLGGFWANYFAQRYDALCVIANPSPQPSVTMAARLGKELPVYGTNRTIRVTETDIAGFLRAEDYLVNNTNGALISLFVAKDDEQLDYREMLEAFPFTAFKAVMETGGHRFERHWYLVVKRVKELVDDV